MSTKAVVTSLFLASGLALAGCAGDPPVQEDTPAARTSPSPTGTAPVSSPQRPAAGSGGRWPRPGGHP